MDNREEETRGVKADETVQAETTETNILAVKEEFFSMISYKIRPSLSTIIEMLETAIDAKDKEKIHDCIINAKNESKHLLDQINDIFDIFKIEEGKLKLSFYNFCFEEMLSKISNVMNPRIEAKKQKLIISVDHYIPEYLFGDEFRLMQVIINFLTYTVNFSPEGGKINLEIEKIKEAAEFITLRMKVSNTGEGILGKHKFFSFFDETYDVQKTGRWDPALVISKKIVEMMDGKIRFETDLDKSESFIFTVKLKTGKAADRKKTDIVDIYDFSGKTILIVDDTEIDREVLNAVLEKTKVDIEFAMNGEDAFTMFRDNQDNFNLILMDIHLPVMNGYEATRKIRSLNTAQSADIPIIAMTANIYKNETEKYLEAGMNGHVGKPVDPNVLFFTIKEHILNKSHTIIRKVESGIKWDDNLLLGIKQLDDQHRQIFDLVNSLVRACDEEEDTTKLKSMLDSLESCMLQHLNDEETLQIKDNYPNFETHKKIHDDFKLAIAHIKKRFSETGSSSELKRDISKANIKWLIDHIMYEDKKVSVYLRNVTEE